MGDVMEIKYTAVWNYEDSKSIRMTHGILTDADLEDAVRRKEDRESIDNTPVLFNRADWDSVDL